jgi:hypothetical protein
MAAATARRFIRRVEAGRIRAIVVGFADHDNRMTAAAAASG